MIIDVKVHGLIALPVCAGALLFCGLVGLRCRLPDLIRLMESSGRTPGRARARALWCQGFVLETLGLVMSAALGTFALLDLDSDAFLFPIVPALLFFGIAIAVSITTMIMGIKKYN